MGLQWRHQPSLALYAAHHALTGDMRGLRELGIFPVIIVRAPKEQIGMLYTRWMVRVGDSARGRPSFRDDITRHLNEAVA